MDHHPEELGVSAADAAREGDTCRWRRSAGVSGWRNDLGRHWFRDRNFLYGPNSTALILLAVFIVSGSALLYVVNTLWTRSLVVAG